MPGLLSRWAALLGLDPEDLAWLLGVCLVLGSMSAGDTIGGAAVLTGADPLGGAKGVVKVPYSAGEV